MSLTMLLRLLNPRKTSIQIAHIKTIVKHSYFILSCDYVEVQHYFAVLVQHVQVCCIQQLARNGNLRLKQINWYVEFMRI